MIHEFGDNDAIVKVSFSRDGWEWFRELAIHNLSPNDTYRADILAADDVLNPQTDDD